MQTLQHVSFFTTLLSLPPKPLLKPPEFNKIQFTNKPFKFHSPFSRSYTSDEYPVGDDEAFLKSFGPKEKESEDEARKRNWIERGWAPWEEILTPEADFARKSLNEGEEVPLQSPEAIEAFKMLSPKYRREKMAEMGLTEDEYYAKQFEIKGEIPEPLETLWTGPQVLGLVPPRDWPPRGWKVDKKELEFIRGAHKIYSGMRVDYEKVEEKVEKDDKDMCFERYNMFVKQYNEWAEANRDRLEDESYKHDQDYHPGRRKRGEKYNVEMYELPFYYPGQICAGKVTAVHLYQGAFVDIGCVYDGWVPIKRNDWYWIRHHIKVGMHVMVEILAKRDPYRFRFPIEMRFVYPKIDHLIFNKFDFPPIFHRDEDTNPDELRRHCGRPPVPRKDPGIKWEEEPLLSNHPYVEKLCAKSGLEQNDSIKFQCFYLVKLLELKISNGAIHIGSQRKRPLCIITKLWEVHNAEQLILDDVEANPDKYKDQKLSELADEDDFDEEIKYGEAYYKKARVPTVIKNISLKELDLEAAVAERQFHRQMKKEADERGEPYKITKLRRNEEMDEYDFIHWCRSFEEREALLRDISCRRALGLPLKEPGRYVDPSFFGKDEYDPDSPLYRYDYWGEPKNSERSKQERATDAHNKSIVGNGTVWYEMSYEDAIKQKLEREALGIIPRQYDEEDSDTDEDSDDEDDEEDFDYSILGSPSETVSNELHVNGTESLSLSDEGMFED